jgi:hypothetical protein
MDKVVAAPQAVQEPEHCVQLLTVCWQKAAHELLHLGRSMLQSGRERTGRKLQGGWSEQAAT